MRKIIMGSICVLLSLSLVGCDSMTKQDVGVVTGGALGALVGSRFGSGSGQAIAIAAGAVAGGLIGGAIGKSMDKADQAQLNNALEYSKSGKATQWRNPDSGNIYRVKPTKTYYSQEGKRYCREYQTEATINGEQQKMYGKACRQPDGSWKAVS